MCERSLRNCILDGGDMRNYMEEKVKKKTLKECDAGISDPNICTQRATAILL